MNDEVYIDTVDIIEYIEDFNIGNISRSLDLKAFEELLYNHYLYIYSLNME